jgi:DNA-dependent RNA polymerase auxiliary subunit epsilon
MRTSQRGITLLGALILVAFVGMFVYAGIRLTPLYLEYMNIAKAMDAVKREATGTETPTSIRTALDKHFNIDYIDSLSAKDIDVTKEGAAWTVHASYDATAPFVANISFAVHFDKTVVIGGSSGP